MLKTKVIKATAPGLEDDINNFIDEIGPDVVSFDIVPDTIGSGLLLIAVIK